MRVLTDRSILVTRWRECVKHRLLVLLYCLLAFVCHATASYAQSRRDLVILKPEKLRRFIGSGSFRLGIPQPKSPDGVELMGPEDHILPLMANRINVLPREWRPVRNVCLLLNNRIDERPTPGLPAYPQHPGYVGYKIKLIYPKGVDKPRKQQISILRSGEFTTAFAYAPWKTLDISGNEFDSIHEKGITNDKWRLSRSWHSTPVGTNRSTWDDRMKWSYGAKHAASIKDADINPVAASIYTMYDRLLPFVFMKRLADELEHELLAWPVSFIPSTLNEIILSEPLPLDQLKVDNKAKRVKICTDWTSAILAHVTAFVVLSGKLEHEAEYLIVLEPESSFLQEDTGTQ